MRYTLFVSDLHLSSLGKERLFLFTNFLLRETAEADALYILGDFFSLWVGDDDRSEFNQEAKKVLRDFSQKIPVYFMPGNRDFLVGEKFALETGVKLLTDPVLVELYGRKVLLSHGDIFCAKEKKYLIFRWLIRREWGKKFFLQLPLKVRLGIAQMIQRLTEKQRDTPDFDIDTEKAAQVTLAQNASLLIHGHVHRAIKDQINFANRSISRVALDKWQNKQGGFLKYGDNDSFELIRF
jgi:UDP-2,3-diacylglucosamine hydrolase